MKKLVKIFMLIVITLNILFLVSCSNSEVKNETYDTVTIEDETTKEKNKQETELLDETSIREVHEVLSPMDVLSISGYRDTDKSTYIEIEFSKPVKDGFDVTPYIKIEPAVKYTVSKVDNKLMVRGDFKAKDLYKITLLNGIKATDGAVTTEGSEEDIYFEQKQPKLMFSSDGIILPSVNEKKVFIRTLNVKKVKVIVRKVYANNLTQFLQNFSFVGNGNFTGTYYDRSEESERRNDYDDEEYYDDYYDYYGSRTSFYDVGDTLHTIDFDIENEVDTWVQSAIDLSNVLDTNGMYMVDVSFDTKGTSYNFPTDFYVYGYMSRNAHISKNILLTDIGLMAQKNDEGYRVNVLDIIDNRPLRGAKVYLMSRNNQILEEKTADSEGTVNFSDHKNAFYILADNVQSKSILPIKNPLSTNGFNVDGAYASNGIKGYIYTERGVYRPGDPIYVSIIARNNDEALLDNQPVKITVYDPTGVKMIDNDVVKDGKNGFYTYTFKTEVASRTGIWKLEAIIGDQTFKKDISVETVVPNKIRVALNIPESFNVNDSTADWSINSTYLFGEPAGGYKYNVSLDISEEPIDFPQYKDYAFKTPSSYGYNTYRDAKGTLDKSGFGNIDVDLSDLQFGSVNLLADVSGRVTEDDGRSVVTKKYVKIKKYDSYIGIENTTSYRAPGSKIDLKAICVSEDGERLVPGKTLKYRVYGNTHYWWWDYSDYDKFIRSFKSDKNTTLLYEGTIVTKDVPVLIDYIIPNEEYLYIELEDPTTGQLTGANLQASEWVDPSVTKKIETLNVLTDKKKYNVGDKAQIRFKGSAGSKALITVEKAGKIINQYYRNASDNEISEQIAITKEMAPNAYVYVTLLQDYKTKQNDRPLRLYGIVPLNVIDDDTKIDLEITAPSQIRPNEKFTVKVRNKKYKKVDFTIAVVDEGLLDITAFKTPTPWEHFFQKIAAKLTLYDNYSEIIDRPYGAVNQILKVGGDESLLDEMARRRRLKELGLEEADRFKPVSMYKGVLSTNEKGEANVEFEMPNYMGSVRIMVIAADGNSYGSAEKNMIVKAPLIVQPTLPRSMKIGDKMSIPVLVFALEDGVGNVEVYYTFKGKTQSKKLNMKKGDRETVYFEEEIDNEVRSENLTVGVKSNIYNYEETVGMAINSNRPAIRISENKTINKGKTETFEQNKKFVKGTVDSMLTLSKTMVLGIDQRLKYLIKYPYGCIEQTTSSVFPQLFIEKLSTNKNFNKSEVVNNINAGIARLQNFQLNDGSLSYWPGDKSTCTWGTNYAAHFLIQAKKQGYYVQDSMYNNLIDYLSKSVRGTKLRNDYDINLKVYSLYLLSLAGSPNISEMNYMFENYYNSKLNLTSKMYLAAAYKLAGENAVSLNLSNNINTKAVMKMYDELIEMDRYYFTNSYGTRLREVAAYLDCYSTIYGKVDEEAFNEILNTLRTNSWYGTQETSYSLLALSNAITEVSKENISGVVDIDGVRTEYNSTGQYWISIPDTAKKITVIPQSEGATYVNYYLEGVPYGGEDEDYAHGFTLSRTFYDEEGKTIDAKNVKAGDVFWLEVTVNAESKNIGRVDNIALTQILPSGWEIENIRVTDSKLPKWVEEKSKDTTVDYTDIRDDRVMWFFSYSRYKNYSFFVKVNAVTKGEYDFPGTSLEAMYDNNFTAYKKGERVKVN